VHPLFFPLVYGRSKILEEGMMTLNEDSIELCGEGKVILVPSKEETSLHTGHGSRDLGLMWYSLPFSQKFQWLPCDINISVEVPDSCFNYSLA